MSDAIQRRFYNAAYTESSSPATSPRGWQKALELHRVDAALGLVPSGNRLLDIGFGNGMLLAKASSRFAHLAGIDISDVQLAHARHNLALRGITNVSLAQGNLDRGLPFVAARFDVVTVIAVLAFVFDPIAALDEIHRVLRPGGVAVIEVLNLVYLPRRLAVLAGQLPVHTSCHGWEGGHLHNFTRPALIQLLRDRGFAVEHCTGSGVLSPMRTWWPGGLLGNVIALARA